MQEFLSTEAAGGILLLVAAAAALIWVNAPFGDTYGDFWHTRIVLDFDVLTLDLALVEWVNDALMAVFFFVVGLEIKRELLRGELADRRSAALPVAAALGGMVVPAAIYIAFNIGGQGDRGWGIPMATDIAFAVGVLSLAGPRVPLSLKIFLLAVAIVDDLGAIAVIAIFYTDDLAFEWLAAAIALFTLVSILGRAGVKDVVVYVVVGLFAWVAVHESGVHATVAGVILGLLTPIGARVSPTTFQQSADNLLDDHGAGRAAGTPEGEETSRSALRELEEMSRESQPVLDRLEHALHGWTSYAIIPIFALANAGVELSGDAIRDAATSPISLGVALGLIVGKPLGITLFAFLAVRAGIAALPTSVTWAQVLGVAMIAGIGFTVSIFIANLAFTDADLVAEAKIGILAGSALIGIAGFALLRLLPPSDTEPPAVDAAAAQSS